MKEKEFNLSEETYYRIIAYIERNDKGDGYITTMGLRGFLRKLKNERKRI